MRPWPANRHGSIRTGTQVKIERFDTDAATRIKAAGFSFVRFGVWVDALRSADYRQRVVRAFASARAADLPVLLTVRSTRALMPAGLDRPAGEAHLRDAAAQLVQAVSELSRTYRAQMLAVELWNEPDLPAYWPTAQVDTTFPLYMNAVCAGLAANPVTVPVIGFGFSTAPVAGTAAEKLLRSVTAGSAHCLAAVSYHAYGMSVPQIQQAASEIRARYGVPALITEWGVSSGGSGGVAAQSQRIGALLAKRNTLATPLISIYEWQDTATAKNARERNFGLVDPLGAAKPALGAAISALGRHAAGG
ncbi:cellulase family glycosylhydrolase [Paraburkholderia sp. MMS20-SJTR3]|uniref:Cellulase family glycosylhydrolase n=1 Tax=Paraburkholderia sejongensis TaxID=2886946 RepID=A0ABS8JY39_9BURK|nr:cellulase family glycosylhydrolase [Paraburkholderia sp. MMS20-SJTR3]MCC8394819.1 cellulase family glycosylhydrolase [Paraburkholderia sp. MMS20-SJTR3]